MPEIPSKPQLLWSHDSQGLPVGSPQAVLEGEEVSDLAE